MLTWGAQGAPARRTALLVLLGLLAGWFALGWQKVEPGRLVVRDSPWLRVSPLRLAPGWHFVPPLVLQTLSYPEGVAAHGFTLGLDGSRYRTREGAEVAVKGTVFWRVEESAVTLLARLAGENVAAVLEPALGEALAAALERSEGLTPRADEALAAELGPRLERFGVALVRVEVEASGLPESLAAARAFSEGPGPLPGAQVLLIGWDGADWNIIDPLLARGDLPHLAGLLARGARGRLKTVAPVLSPVIWTSVATGARPEKHGIVDFLAVDRSTGEKVPVTSNLRTMPALWTLLSRRAIPVGVIGWWATWPAEPVTGYVIADRTAYQLFGMGEKYSRTSEGKTWPPELFGEVESLIQRPEEVGLDEVRRYAPIPPDLEALGPEERERVAEFKTVLAATRTYADISLHLSRTRPAVLRCFYFEATDTAAHLFMPFHPPRQVGIGAEAFRLWSGVVDEIYREHDRILGELLATTGPSTTVMIVSDHGFRSGEQRPPGDARIGAGKAADWHRKYGIIVLAGPGIRPDFEIEEASVLDVAPTTLVLLGLPVPSDMDGEVLEGALEEEFLAAHPPRRSGAVGQAAGAAGGTPLRSGEDEAMVERLRTLGYLGSEDVDRLSQDEATAYNNRATIMLGEGKVKEAIAELEEGLRRAPGSIPLRINLGRAQRMAHDDRAALETLEGVLRDDPKLPMVENLVGNIYMDRKEYDTASRHFLQALSVDPAHVDALVSLGILAERQGQRDEALARYARAAAIDPDSAEPFNNIGNLHREKALAERTAGKGSEADRAFREAEDAYRQALRADPDFIGTYNNLGLLFQDMGRTGEAEALYREALDRHPEHAVVLNNLGSLEFAHGRPEEALRLFERAIAADPAYESAYNNLGATLGHLGRADEELAAYRKAIEIRPDYADAHHNLGMAALRRGDRDEARAELSRAIDLNPHDVGALATLGEIELRMGRTGPATALMRRAVAAQPESFPLRNLLAETYLKSGDRKRAAAEYRESLRIEPAQPEVQRRLDELGG